MGKRESGWKRWEGHDPAGLPGHNMVLGLPLQSLSVLRENGSGYHGTTTHPPHLLPQAGNKDAPTPHTHPAWWPGASMFPLPLASLPQGSPARGDGPKALGTHGTQGYTGKVPLGTLSMGQDPSRVRAAPQHCCASVSPPWGAVTLAALAPASIPHLDQSILPLGAAEPIPTAPTNQLGAEA